MKTLYVWCGGLLVMVLLAIANGSSEKVTIPDPAVDDPLASASSQTSAVVAGGCFWGIEEIYQHVRGVLSATSGYAGGPARSATYEQVSTGKTGHAESVKVVYDPSKISYGQLLRVFLSVAHDPTQRGGQGPDMGPQYRSAIFYASERQQAIAQAYLTQLRESHVFGKKAITTELVPLDAFYDAEAYHQDYAARNPNQPYILMFDRPKVDALRKEFPQLYITSEPGKRRD